MLTNIHVEHYKAFEGADVPIKPITILLGANSVGKSSIIQLLLALEQTAAVEGYSYRSALKIYGSSVNLGSTENIFRRFDTKNPVILMLSLKNEDLLKEFKSMKNSYLEAIQRPVGIFPVSGFKKMANKKIKNKKDYLSYIRGVNTSINKNAEKIYKERIKYLTLTDYDLSYDMILNSQDVQLGEVFDFLDGLSNLPESNFDFRFKVCYADRSKLSIGGFTLSCGDNILLSYETKGNKVEIKSSFISLDDEEIEAIRNNFRPSNTLFTCLENVDPWNDNYKEYNIAVRYILRIVNKALSALMLEFGTPKINHVSPLRAHPKRYYMLDKAKVSYTLDTLDGDAIAEVLKENGILRKKVNKWLGKFKLSVDVEEFKEVIHHLKVNQNDLSLDITDVGFGISQVLPIIIQGFMSKNDSLTIIEQPEIHLHPKMQADLADLFIDMIGNNDEKQIIVETHSEYLLKRLRRRISERKISPDQVSICLFHPQTEKMGGVIEHINIEEKGYFAWPEEYYDGELFKDLTVFLKNQ